MSLLLLFPVSDTVLTKTLTATSSTVVSEQKSISAAKSAVESHFTSQNKATASTKSSFISSSVQAVKKKIASLVSLFGSIVFMKKTTSETKSFTDSVSLVFTKSPKIIRSAASASSFVISQSFVRLMTLMASSTTIGIIVKTAVLAKIKTETVLADAKKATNNITNTVVSTVIRAKKNTTKATQSTSDHSVVVQKTDMKRMNAIGTIASSLHKAITLVKLKTMVGILSFRKLIKTSKSSSGSVQPTILKKFNATVSSSLSNLAAITKQASLGKKAISSVSIFIRVDEFVFNQLNRYFSLFISTVRAPDTITNEEVVLASSLDVDMDLVSVTYCDAVSIESTDCDMASIETTYCDLLPDEFVTDVTNENLP